MTGDQPSTDGPSGLDAGGNTATRPLRADAKRNRARVLEAAEIAFAEKGTAASTEEIARAAGVGVGTVFRHFPTKELLLQEVLMTRMSRLLDEARELTAAAAPGEAFFTFCASFVVAASTKSALTAALADVGIKAEDLTKSITGDFLAAVGVLIDRAAEAGAVRNDVGPHEVISVLYGASRTAEHVNFDPALSARCRELVLDGLRPRPAQAEN